jgi:hypothetical protein
MDGFPRDDQRGIAKGKIVHIPTHRPLFDAQSTTAETLMVALTALERTVEKHNQPWIITHYKHASALRPSLLSTSARWLRRLFSKSASRAEMLTI